MTDTYTPPVSSDRIEGRPLPPAAPIWTPEGDPDRVNREAPYMQASRALGLWTNFADTAGKGLDYLEYDAARARSRQRNRVFGAEFGTDAPLSPEEANERYGVPGRLSFDRPVDPVTAGWRHSVAQREAFREEVTAASGMGWWETMGATFAGSLVDPVMAPLWLVPELGAWRLLKSGLAASRLARFGPVARGAVTGGLEGIAGGVLYQGANLWIAHEAADDYSFGEASANVLFGGLLGAAVGGGGGWWEGRHARGRAPRVVEDLSPDSRMGAFVEALDAVREDRPVDLSPMLVREAEARASGRMAPEVLERLDDAAPGEGIAARWADDRFGDVAVTPRGREVPVRFALVEARDLITSHDDDLFRNPDYPSELQPRQRDRAGAQARNRALEAELNPKRLISDVGAETGAPIISADGVVESGNGRTIAIRRSAMSGGPAYERYRAELAAQGLDVEGMEAPVLVRVRQGVLDGGERVKLTRDMNAEATEGYSPSERAVTDAEALDDGLLGMVEGADLNGAGNRRFVRAFLERVAPDDLNRMTTADGRLSDAGLDRISAAMTARAYGDRSLVEALFEATDSSIKAIGRGLAEAAPEWAAMRAAVMRGEAPAELDPTAALTAAVNFVRQVRARGGSIAEAMDLTIGQYDAFNGAAMTPETEAFVRSFFRTSKEGVSLWKSPRSAASLADGLRWLAGEIRKAEPGPNLFGEVADAATGRQLLDAFGRWFAGDDGAAPLDFGPDPTVPRGGAPGADGGNVRPDGAAGGRVVGRPDAGGEAARSLEALPGSALLEAGGAQSKPKVAKGAKPAPPKGDPYSDPEIAALAADTDAALLRAGLDPVAVAADLPPGQDPQTVADAIAAGAFCLKGSA